MSMSLSILLFCPCGFFLICVFSWASLFMASFIFSSFMDPFEPYLRRRKKLTSFGLYLNSKISDFSAVLVYMCRGWFH